MPQVLQIGRGGTVERKELPPEEYQALVENPRTGNGSSSPIVAPLVNKSMAVEPEQDAAARARFDRHRKKRGPVIVPKAVDGEEYYIKCLDTREIDLLFMLTPRTKVGVTPAGETIWDIDLAAETTWDALRPAILHVGLASSAEDDTPYMSLELAHKLCADRSMGAIIFELCAHVSELNTEIVPKAPGPKAALSSSDSPGIASTAPLPPDLDSSRGTSAETEIPSPESQEAADST